MMVEIGMNVRVVMCNLICKLCVIQEGRYYRPSLLTFCFYENDFICFISDGICFLFKKR